MTRRTRAEARLIATARSRRARYRYRRYRDNREPSTKRTIGMPGRCWCGLENGHDWPGKERGRVHP